MLFGYSATKIRNWADGRIDRCFGYMHAQVDPDRIVICYHEFGRESPVGYGKIMEFCSSAELSQKRCSLGVRYRIRQIE